MKKFVFCLAALSFVLPITSVAEEVSSTTEDSTVQSSSVADSTQATENSYTKTADSRYSSTIDASTTESSSTAQTAYGDFIDSTLVVSQGEKITAEMLYDDGSSHGAAFRELKLLEEPSTETLGKNRVNVSFMVYPLEEGQGDKQKITLEMGYTVIKATPTYDIQFISYTTENNEIKGRVLSTDSASTNGLSIIGYNISGLGATALSVKELYSLTTPSHSTTTDAQGYFILPYQDNFSFAAFNSESGDYSTVYTLTDKAFAGATGTTDTSKTTKSTESSSEKKEEKKTGLFPNTGEKKTVYLSIAGIAIILLAILFLFIKSKKK